MATHSVLLLLPLLGLVFLGWSATLATCTPSENTPRIPGSVLQGKVNALLSSNSPSYTIPAGDYVFGQTSFLISNAVNFTLTAEPGVTLWFQNPAGMQLVNCVQTTVSNIVIDYDPPTFAQGRLTAYDMDSQFIVADFDGTHFPLPDPSLNHAFTMAVVKLAFWDSKTLQEVPGLGNQFYANGTRLGNGTAPSTVSYAIRPRVRLAVGPKVGDWVTVSPRWGFTYLLTNCSDTTTTSVTIHGGGNMGFVEDGGVGRSVWDNIAVVRRPNQDPVHLLALNADGFHSSSTQFGPTLVNSEISFTGDDFINVHNKLGVVCAPASLDTVLYVVDSGGGTTFRQAAAQDGVSLFHINSLEQVWNGTLAAVPHTVTNSTIVKQCDESFNTANAPPVNAKILHPWGSSIWRLEFTSAVPPSTMVGLFPLVQLDKVTARNALVSNCSLHDGYASVAKVKGVGMRVLGNRFTRARGVHVFTEQAWLEGDVGLHNVTVGDNVFVDCGTTEASSLSVAPYVNDVVLFNNSFVLGPA